MLRAFLSGAMGAIGAVIYCSINKISFSEDKYNIPSGKLCIYMGTLIGLLLGIIIRQPKILYY